jgi:hypothetical protein
MKNRMVLYAGIALIVALYLYDSSSKTEILIPATVVAIESQTPEKGGDTWHMTVAVDAGKVVLEPRASRPDVALDDRICVTEVVREGQTSEYRFAPFAVC